MNNLFNKYKQKYIGEGVLLFMTITWGATFVIVKESLDSLSPTLFVGIRFCVASVILLPILLFKIKKWNIKVVLPGVILGSLLFLGFEFQTIGLKYTTASRSGFITGTLVIMIPLFQTFIEKKFPSKGALFGISLVFLGLIFLSSNGNTVLGFLHDIGSDFNLGDWLTLICAAIFALQVVYIDIFSSKHEFWTLLFIQLATVAVEGLFVAAIFSFIGFEQIHFEMNSYILFAFLYTAVLATLVNIGLQTKFQKLVTPAKAGIIYSFEPIFSAALAFFVLSEKISNFGLIGCALIFSGLVVSELYDSLVKKNGNGLKESGNIG